MIRQFLHVRTPRHMILDHKQSGWFLVSAMIMIIFLSAIGFSIAALVALQYQHTKREAYVQNAELTAEAGIEQSVAQLNNNSSFTGYSSPQTFYVSTRTFTTTITTNADGTSKTIISIGKVYQSSSSTTPYVTRGVKATIVGTTSTGFSVATGPGGLILDGTSSITNSSVAVGGMISLQGNSSIGTQANPVTVDAGNIACPTSYPPGSSYPQLCTNGNQPISLGSNTNIWGTVCATGQTSTGPNNNIQGGNGGSGLEVGCIAPTVTQPVYNRSAIIGAIPGANVHSGTSGSYACGGSNKNINIPANTELTGNVSWGSSCNITINGNVYITGSLSIAGQVTLAAGAGTTRPAIIVDSTIGLTGSPALNPNASGTGMDFVSFANCIGGTNTSCKNGSSNPAATPTGTDLYNSQQQINVTVGGHAQTPGMVFDAYWSEVELEGGGHIGAAAGQTVYLHGTGSVIFGTTLSSGSETWSITSYEPYY